jgi:hypothetical protein
VLFSTLAFFIRQIFQLERKELSTNGFRHFVANESETEHQGSVSALKGVAAPLRRLKVPVTKLFLVSRL